MKLYVPRFKVPIKFFEIEFEDQGLENGFWISVFTIIGHKIIHRVKDTSIPNADLAMMCWNKDLAIMRWKADIILLSKCGLDLNRVIFDDFG